MGRVLGCAALSTNSRTFHVGDAEGSSKQRESASKVVTSRDATAGDTNSLASGNRASEAQVRGI